MNSRIASIDMLRGFAILWVIGYHTWTDLRFPNVYPRQSDAFREVVRQLTQADVVGAIAAAIEAFLRVGYLGVPLFMMLSGYSLTFTALVRTSTPGREWRSVPRRLRKVMLPYWVAFALTIAFAAVLAIVQWWRHGGAPLSDYLRYGDISLKADQLVAGALLVPRMFRDEWQFAPSGALWFVLVLVQYYLLFPLLLRALRRFGALDIAALTFAISLASLVTMVAVAGDLVEHRSWVEMAAPFRIVEFGAGVALAATVISHRQTSTARVKTRSAIASVSLSLAVFVSACLISPDDGYLAALQMPLVIGAFVLLTMPLLAIPSDPLSSLLPARALAWVGVVSYTVLIVNEPLRSITHTMRAEGAPTTWLTLWVVCGLFPLTFLLAHPLARTLGLIGRESATSVTVSDLIDAEGDASIALPGVTGVERP